jgi:hypothetical protein
VSILPAGYGLKKLFFDRVNSALQQAGKLVNFTAVQLGTLNKEESLTGE